MMCKICGERAESFGKTMVLGKYLVIIYAKTVDLYRQKNHIG